MKTDQFWYEPTRKAYRAVRWPNLVWTGFANLMTCQMICQLLSLTDHETRNSRAVSITAFAKTDQARDLKLTVFLRSHQRRLSYDSYLLLHFSLVFQRNPRLFSCSSTTAEAQKIYKSEFLRRFSWNGSYADWQVLAWVAIPLWYTRYSIVLRHLSWQSNLLSFKSGHCHGKGNDRYLYLCLHGWWL